MTNSTAIEPVLGIAIAYLVVLAIYTLGGILPKSIRRKLPIPLQVVVLLSGMAVSAIAARTDPVPYATDAVMALASISPSVMSDVFIPALIMTSSLSLRWHNLHKMFLKSMMLAVFGTYINVILIAVILRFVLPLGWSWAESLLAGSILAVIDPLIPVLESSGGPVLVRTMITTEASLNHGVAYVLYQIFSRWAAQGHLSGRWVVEFFFKASFGSPLLGLAWAAALTAWIIVLSQDTVAAPAATLTAVFSLWYLSNNVVELSGALSVLSCSIFFSCFGRYWMSKASRDSFDRLWGFVKWTANNLIFFIVGLVIASEFTEIKKENDGNIEAADLGYACILWLFLLVFRGTVIFLFSPLLRRGMQGLNWKDSIIVFWSGTRGSLALIWSLTVYLKTSEFRYWLQHATLLIFRVPKVGNYCSRCSYCVHSNASKGPKVRYAMTHMHAHTCVGLVLKDILHEY